jgi:hypothetical protein
MHGKTTVSAMTAHALRAAGVHPSHYVGAEIPILGTNARWDAGGEYFVAEGDESDGTIVLYHPEHTIVLNIEPEHLDHYADLAAIDAAFFSIKPPRKYFTAPTIPVRSASVPIARVPFLTAKPEPIPAPISVPLVSSPNFPFVTTAASWPA